ncbi:hypothetical protein AMAG_15583 [Allomyces macrogynus ATCC 38327]|uniref:Uncharacterized protein n=1 Tax=Allomyces macrogynus (strain ATCC 38327) TaxID=578462 RepID=A0A0L0T9G2_ALLM3|nr:hypothetical protein AMAG_15583 [Allomyces macrogynus ATCC 38327]|eukprot:KNE71350.1 hypothetical protein AMAG_15583 [Allomyces macrogynus ATCC 38327]
MTNLLLLLALALVALAASTVSASPMPNRGPGPNDLPPPNPVVQIQYTTGYYAYPSAPGEHPQQALTCLGVYPINYINPVKTYSDGRRAYKVQLFGDWGCKGAPVAETDSFYQDGQTLKGADGKEVIAKSMRFAP